MQVLAEAANLADWVAAVGQALGALFTAAAVGVAVWLGVRDRRWRREEQSDRDAAQARLITVEIHYEAVEWDPHIFLVRITNRSIEPIFEVDLVTVEALGHDGHPWTVDYGPYEPTAEINGRVVAAGDRYQFPAAYTDENGRNISLTGGDRVTIIFTDAKGLRWQRCGPALPERIVAPEFPRTYWWHGPWWRFQARGRRIGRALTTPFR